MVRTTVSAVAFAALGLLAAPSWSAELVFGGGSADCSTLSCPPGVNCDILVRPACQRCIADRSRSFVIRCGDASCSSFGAMTCEPARGATVPADPVPAECREAKINVDWVISRDDGAKGRYLKLRREGKSPVDAVIGAQAHNRHAQDTIRLCSGWASSYLAAKGMGSGGMRPDLPSAQNQRIPSTCSVKPTNGCSPCSKTCPEGNAICDEGSGGVWGDPPRLTCNVPSSCRCYPSR